MPTQQPPAQIFVIPGINDDILTFFRLSTWCIRKKFGRSHNLQAIFYPTGWLKEDAASIINNIDTLCQRITDQPPRTQVHLIGSSAGAVVALLCAIQAPRAVTSVTVFSGWLKVTPALELLNNLPYTKIVKKFQKKYAGLNANQKKALGKKTLLVQPKIDTVIPDEVRHLPYCQEVELPFIEHFGISNLGLLYSYIWPGNEKIIGHSIKKMVQ
ncbi:MAG: alpha/beta hydrolase [Patescibacteria group bacterium]